uniref:RNA polymerase sigma-70 factor n=1 Tax=uncultured organism TaxID=155900 RepID=K7NAG6_9ZZZZ|nr:RNA polymerase sigma-70 factor [uncultured organism]
MRAGSANAMFRSAGGRVTTTTTSGVSQRSITPSMVSSLRFATRGETKLSVNSPSPAHAHCTVGLNESGGPSMLHFANSSPIPRAAHPPTGAAGRSRSRSLPSGGGVSAVSSAEAVVLVPSSSRTTPTAPDKEQAQLTPKQRVASTTENPTHALFLPGLGAKLQKKCDRIGLRPRSWQLCPKDRRAAGHGPYEPAFVSQDQAIDSGSLFCRHAPFVANFLVRLGVDRSELDDVVQDVFMIAHRRGGYIPGPARPTTWLASIALRVNANRRRSQRRARVQTDMTPIERAASMSPSPSEAAEVQESLERVQVALDAMDESMRSVFVLFELADEPCEAIAAGLGIPVGTVYSRLHAARKQFAKAHRRLLARASLSTPPPTVNA